MKLQALTWTFLFVVIGAVGGSWLVRSTRLRENPVARELAGYGLLAGAGAAAVVRGREVRDAMRWAIHAAARLVPEPEHTLDDDELEPDADA